MIEKSGIGEVFDEISKEYDGVMDNMVPHYRKLIRAMFEYLPKELSPLRILDLGCGNGNAAMVAASIFRKAQIDLVDASEEMLTLCRAKLGEGLFKYTCSTFQELQVPDEEYQLIFAGFSLHHLEGHEKRSFFKSIYRALSGGGIFACADLFIDKNSDAHVLHLDEWKQFCFSNGKTEDDWDWLMDHYSAYDKPNAIEDQEVWLREAGFSDFKLSWNVGQWGCFHVRR